MYLYMYKYIYIFLHEYFMDLMCKYTHRHKIRIYCKGKGCAVWQYNRTPKLINRPSVLLFMLYIYCVYIVLCGGFQRFPEVIPGCLLSEYVKYEYFGKPIMMYSQCLEKG